MIGAAFLVAIAGVVVWAVMYAQFPSRCSACGDAISEGDAIVNVDGDWIHEECA